MKESEIKVGESYSNGRGGGHLVIREVIEINTELDEVKFKTTRGSLSYWERKYQGHAGICTIKSFAKWAIKKQSCMME